MTSSSVPTIRATGPADLLALVPYLLGFQPKESITAILLTHSQLKLTARVDLPPPEWAEQAADSFGQRLAEQTEQDRIDQVILAVFSQDDELARRVLEQIAVRGDLPVDLAVHTDGRQFWVLGPDGMSPPQDYEPSTTVAAATAVAAGMAPVDCREDLESMVAFYSERHEEAMEGADGLDELTDDADRVQLMRQTVEQSIADEMSPRQVALLGLLTLDMEARDAAWLMMDRDNAEDHLEVWLAVARAMRGALAAGPAVLAGMAAWLHGNGALAWCCVDRAHAESEGYSFAGLLAGMLSTPVHPDKWAEFRPQLMAGVEAA